MAWHDKGCAPRLGRVLRAEVSALQPRLGLVTPLVAMLPPLAFQRVRTSLYRLGGLAIGRGSLIAGRLRILAPTRMSSRLRIDEVRGGEPYRLASVEYHGDIMGEPAVLESSRRRLLTALSGLAEGAAVFLSRPDLSHELFANAVCQYLDLSAVEKMSLLDCDSVAARYQRLLEILEFRALERTHGGGSTDPIVH